MSFPGSPRLSWNLRTLLTVQLIVCFGLAAWSWNRERVAVQLHRQLGGQTTSPLPFLLRNRFSDNVEITTTYHVWTGFGLARLPYSSVEPETGGFYSVVRPRIVWQPDDEPAQGSIGS